MTRALVVAELEARLRKATARLDYLEGIAVGLNLDPMPACLSGLSPQGRALIGVLARARGRVVPLEMIAAKLPNRTVSAGRDPDRVALNVHFVRARLGKASIETVYGEGYRIGPALYSQLQAAV